MRGAGVVDDREITDCRNPSTFSQIMYRGTNANLTVKSGKQEVVLFPKYNRTTTPRVRTSYQCGFIGSLHMVSNGNRTNWSPIRSAIISRVLLQAKLDDTKSYYQSIISI